MDLQEPKNIITQARNIYLITSQESEAIASTLALFYTLKNLGKNVNLIIDSLPENLKFLAPSLDFISYPKNFVISIPDNVAKVSQIYYEKNPDALKIHLTLEGGHIKKDNISFYFSETKPDLIITVGIKDYQKELTGRLNPFGFLLDSPILNIDNSKDNKNFGKINLISNSSLSEATFGLIKNITGPSMNKELAACILTGVVLYTENFKNRLTAEIFQMASELMKSGASLQEITQNIYKI